MTHTDPVVLTWEWAPGNVRSMKLLWVAPSIWRLLVYYFRFLSHTFFLKKFGFRFDFFSRKNSTFFSIFSEYFFSIFHFFLNLCLIFFFLSVLGKKSTFFLYHFTLEKNVFFNFLGLKRQTQRSKKLKTTTATTQNTPKRVQKVPELVPKMFFFPIFAPPAPPHRSDPTAPAGTTPAPTSWEDEVAGL